MADASNGSGDMDLCSEGQTSEPTTLLLLPLLLSLVWVLLDLFYSAAILGWLASRLASLVLTDSGIHIGEPSHTDETQHMTFQCFRERST